MLVFTVNHILYKPRDHFRLLYKKSCFNVAKLCASTTLMNLWGLTTYYNNDIYIVFFLYFICYRTAHLISSYKPRAPILTITRNGQTARQAHLYRGVFPIHYMGMYACFTTLEPNTPTHPPNCMQYLSNYLKWTDHAWIKVVEFLGIYYYMILVDLDFKS